MYNLLYQLREIDLVRVVQKFYRLLYAQKSGKIEPGLKNFLLETFIYLLGGGTYQDKEIITISQ